MKDTKLLYNGEIVQHLKGHKLSNGNDYRESSYFYVVHCVVLKQYRSFHPTTL